MLVRALRLSGPLSYYSLFLFGPRQTGKTTYLRQELPHATFYNLLEANVFREISQRPELIRQRLTGREEVIVIDEIQRLPELLYEIQAMIDRNPALRFVMTGSSARSLRAKGINLLGGRAGLINSGGASGANDMAEAVKTAVINKRAGGMGMISGRKAFQRPRAEGIQLLHAIQDVYLCDDVTIA